VSSRPDLLTTLEAINLANGPELSSLLRDGAAQLSKRHQGPALVDHVFIGALTRQPSTREKAIAAELLGSPPTPAGTEDLLWMVFMLPEFFYVN
jgi:hypothetical protein